jgi:hypothetical protein
MVKHGTKETYRNAASAASQKVVRGDKLSRSDNITTVIEFNSKPIARLLKPHRLRQRMCMDGNGKMSKLALERVKLRETADRS